MTRVFPSKVRQKCQFKIRLKFDSNTHRIRFYTHDLSLNLIDKWVVVHRFIGSLTLGIYIYTVRCYFSRLDPWTKIRDGYDTNVGKWEKKSPLSRLLPSAFVINSLYIIPMFSFWALIVNRRRRKPMRVHFMRNAHDTTNILYYFFNQNFYFYFFIGHKKSTFDVNKKHHAYCWRQIGFVMSNTH